VGQSSIGEGRELDDRWCNTVVEHSSEVVGIAGGVRVLGLYRGGAKERVRVLRVWC
jgi:hypothetical protein